MDKAIHYLIKTKEAFLEGRLKNTSFFGDKAYMETAQQKTRHWLDINEITGIEAEFMWAAADWQNEADLSIAIGKARQVRDMAVAHAEQVQEAYGQAGGTVGQGAASSASTGRSEGSGTNHPAPFGYDDWHEGDI